MTTIYLIRHSKKMKLNGIIENNDSFQTRNEKIILSVEGEELARRFADINELSNIDEIWSSNYVRAILTAKYIASRNNLDINISDCFDERHHGNRDEIDDKELFWIEQFQNLDLQTSNGESGHDVQKRFDKKIKEILNNSHDKKIAIVCHNAAILFYILKFCKLESARVNKKLTITYNDKLLIDADIMRSPSMFKLIFDKDKLIDIEYITMR